MWWLCDVGMVAEWVCGCMGLPAWVFGGVGLWIGIILLACFVDIILWWYGVDLVV